MPQYNSGNGGGVTVGIIVLPLSQWTCNTGSRTVENTHSGTGGFTNYENVVIDARGTLEGPLDEDNLPDTDAGLYPGLKPLLTLKNGADARVIVITGAIIEDYEVTVNNSNNIVVWRATFKGGVVTRMTT